VLLVIGDHPGFAVSGEWPPLVGQGVVSVKKGRHRRFEEARSLKRSVATANRRCPECGAELEDKHASWCMATEDDYDEILGTAPKDSSFAEDDPLAE
jgi:hypothetical protein